MARRKASSRTQLRLLGGLALVAALAGGFGWWHLHHWLPGRDAYPIQGVEIGSQDGEVNWRSIKAIGADFAYIDASASAFARDPVFSHNLEQARAAELQVGAVHRYDPCQPAEKQAGNFVTVVPRDPALLPPAVELDMLADDCPIRVSDAAIESELTTFLNQVETHTGKPALLKVSERFEERYGIAARVDRNLWLVRDRFQPDYGGRPWTLWTANTSLANEADREPLRWVVVQP
ncbi:MAG: glycoside hydrolase family 25 protein [Novosphingobium sp.]|nr:glycoside hydrolase family 25 protein [Novosphingobium sp.]MCP5404107.1 glycoside hydrolase family 25 protein [Novosphingobium sp.]